VLALPHSVGALVTAEPSPGGAAALHRGSPQGTPGPQEPGPLRSAFRGWAGALAEGGPGGLAPDDDADVVPGVRHEAPQEAQDERVSEESSGPGMLIASMHTMHGATMRGSRGAPKPDVLALAFSLLGGICMSAYPVPMKAPSVMAVNVHPVFFQFYKSFWVFVTGLCFLVSNWLRGQAPVFNFSWLGGLSAAFWIPAGVCCITAVPRLGMGLTMTLLAGTAATMSFLVFWLVLGESMKVHHLGTTFQYYTAPLYLLLVVGLMALLVAVPNLGHLSAGKKHPPLVDEPPADGPCESAGKKPTKTAAEETPEGKGEQNFDNILDRVVGFSAALMAGACCTIQFGVVNVAKRYVLGSCADSTHQCPPNIVEKFDIFGSWMASFGIGALGISLAAVCMVWTIEGLKGQAYSSFHWKVMWLPGNLAGICWAAGNVFQLAALTRGGSAVMMPFNQGCSLMLTGLWGLLYYKEVKGTFLSTLWLAVAGCLVAAIVLLSHEKES